MSRPSPLPSKSQHASPPAQKGKRETKSFDGKGVKSSVKLSLGDQLRSLASKGIGDSPVASRVSSRRRKKNESSENTKETFITTLVLTPLEEESHPSPVVESLANGGNKNARNVGEDVEEEVEEEFEVETDKEEERARVNLDDLIDRLNSDDEETEGCHETRENGGKVPRFDLSSIAPHLVSAYKGNI